LQLLIILSQFALCGHTDDATVPLNMFQKARRLHSRLDLGSHGYIDNYNITVNVSHLNRELNLYLRKHITLFEISELPGEVKIKIPAVVGENYLSSVFKKKRACK